MSPSSQADRLLVRRVREGDPRAWEDLIARFEGRLLAFVEARIGNRSEAEDVVQETFLGFLTSLPNYDQRRSLESYLFSIAAHKLTDCLRRQGRRPELPLGRSGSKNESDWEPAGKARAASSIARSGERRRLEHDALARALQGLIQQWRAGGQWRKLMCCELLFVRGWPNKEVARRLGVSEQTVANIKFEFLKKLQVAVRKQ